MVTRNLQSGRTQLWLVLVLVGLAIGGWAGLEFLGDAGGVRREARDGAPHPMLVHSEFEPRQSLPLPQVPAPAVQDVPFDELDPGILDGVEGAEEEASSLSQSSMDHVPRERFPHRLFVSPDVFEEKYAGASLDDLAMAKALVKEQSLAVRFQAIDHFFDTGQGVSWVVDPTGQLAGDDEPALVGPTDGLLQVARSEPLGDGQRVIKRKGALPWEEYVAYYDLQDEVFWLNRQRSKREEALGEAAKEAAKQGK